LFWPVHVFNVAHVRTLFLLLWRDLRGRFTGWNGIASHCFLEPWR
jgi:hypothetical protein